MRGLDTYTCYNEISIDIYPITDISNQKKPIATNSPEKGFFLYAENTITARWQERKKDSLTHPFLKEKIPWGLVPFVQALLLARFLRGDLDTYPPFLWK